MPMTSFSRLSKALLGLTAAALIASPSTSGQQRPTVLRPSGVGEIILAAADAQPRSPDKAGEVSAPLQTFNQVVWDDLKFAGYFTMAGKSFYPPQPITKPEDVNYDAWGQLPFKVDYL